MAFQCTVITPEQELLDQKVSYASIPAWDGLLGVATQRAPLLVKLGDGPLRLDTEDGKSQLYFIGGGFAQMQNNTLSLLAAEAIAAGDIDADGRGNFGMQDNADLVHPEFLHRAHEDNLAACDGEPALGCHFGNVAGRDRTVE